MPLVIAVPEIVLGSVPISARFRGTAPSLFACLFAWRRPVNAAIGAPLRYAACSTCHRTSSKLEGSIRPADAESEDLGQGARVGVGPEDGKRVARDGTVVPGPLERRLDGIVFLHQSDGAIEVAFLDLALAERTLPECALAVATAPEAQNGGQG